MKICIFLMAILAHSIASEHGPLLTAITQSRFLNNRNGSIGTIIKEHARDLSDAHQRDKRNLFLGLAAGAVGGGVVGVGLLKAGMYGAKALGAGALGGILATKAYTYGHGPEEFGYAYGPGPGFVPVIGQGGGVPSFGSIFVPWQGTSYGPGYEAGFGPGYGPGYGPRYGPGYDPGYRTGNAYNHRYGSLPYGCRC